MSITAKSTSELLAPAGSLEAFFAAMEAGADAVYCGLTEFSARAKARNFTLSETERLTALAHQQGRRLYVALNTLIKERELPRLLELLSALTSFAVDGLIIQDLGLWRLARQHFPELPLHASTQMTVHNAAGVKVLEGLGFARVVLARELSLTEISAIRQQTTVELEHFVHGALCYSLSGQCLFSSQLTGNSGNRGRCAQPCRRRYTTGDKSGLFFSTSDLSAIRLLPRLRAAGVMSFKIEGRMKNAEYVHTVVTAYRAVLDAQGHELPQAINEAEAALVEAFGRGTTTGLLKGAAPAGIASPSTKGGIGQLLGQVERAQGKTVWLTPSATVHVGDRLRIQPQTDLAGAAFTVQGLFSAGRPVKRAEAGRPTRLETPFAALFKAGDPVYKVSTGKGFTLSAEACQRRLAAVDLPALPLRLTIGCPAPNRLSLTATVSGCQLSRDYEVEMLPAQQSPLNQQSLQTAFAKTGQPTLRLAKLRVGPLPSVAVKPSRLNELRRDFYASLSQQVEEARGQRQRQRLLTAQASLLPPLAKAPLGDVGWTVVGRGARDQTILDQPTLSGRVSRLLLPLTPANVQAVSKGGQPDRQRLGWDIPAVIFEDEWQAFQTVVTRLIKQGYRCFRLNNISHFALFRPDDNPTLLAGPWLYAINSQAALALQGLGCDQFTLSLEDDRDNMAEVLARAPGAKAMVIVHSPIALLTSRIPMRQVQQGAILTASTGESLRLDFSSGLTIAYAEHDLSLGGKGRELGEMGCRQWLIDLSHKGLNSQAGQAVLKALLDDQPLPETSTFNFERGLA